MDDYTDKYNVQYCDLVGLPDLATSSSKVQQTLADYINLAKSWGVSGIRVDAAKHQDASELGQVFDKLDSGLYIGMEVIGGGGEPVTPSMYYDLGQVSEFSYAYDVSSGVKNQNQLNKLETLGESWGLMPDKYAVVFMGMWCCLCF